MEDLHKFRFMERVPLERLKIDVGLCGQYLIMNRREEHLQNVISLLGVSSICVFVRMRK